MNATWFQSLAEQVAIPTDGTISRTIYQDERLKVLVFGFAAGQELSKHTAAMPAIIQIIRGSAVLVLGDEVIEARPHTWAYMPAHLPHSVSASTPVIMLLMLLKHEQRPVGQAT